MRPLGPRLVGTFLIGALASASAACHGDGTVATGAADLHAAFALQRVDGRPLPTLPRASMNHEVLSDSVLLFTDGTAVRRRRVRRVVDGELSAGEESLRWQQEGAELILLGPCIGVQAGCLSRMTEDRGLLEGDEWTVRLSRSTEVPALYTRVR